jgi:hypothetical protein
MVAARLYGAGNDQESRAGESVGVPGLPRRAADAPGRDLDRDEYDGLGVLRGITLGLLLSVPAWFWVVLWLREALG